MSAQRKDEQESAQIVRSIFKLAGTLAGTTVGIGKKAPGYRAFVKVKALAAALESELDTANHELATLESEFAVANRKLDRTREKTKKTRFQLLSQLKAFQAESESLNSALKQAKNKTRGAKIKGSKMGGRVATLESELDTANRKLDKTREKTKKKQSQLSSQLKAFQAESESLNSALKQAKNKTRGAKIKGSKMGGRVATLETELTTANSKLAEIQVKVEKTQSQLSAQLEVLQEKNKSATVAKKINAVKAKVDQLIQQICDSCSQTQPDTIEITKQ